VFLVVDVWNEEFVEEVCGFPAKAHDEYVDLIGYAIDFHLKRKGVPIDLARMANLAR
jgi:phage terminase large subunit-like protein